MGKSLTPMFTIANISKRIEQFADARVDKAIESLQYVGENFVNNARNTGKINFGSLSLGKALGSYALQKTKNYIDRTDNLRSSIGYVILYNGKIKDLDVKSTGGQDGVSQAKKLARE